MSASTSLLESLVGRPSEVLGTGEGRSTKAVAWARVSTDMQEERGMSIPEQLREMRLYAEKQGIEITDEFSEAASAYQNSSKRVEFHRMLAAVRSDPEITAILVHDFSRFSRDSVQAKTLVRELRHQGVRVISLNDPDIDPESVAGVYMEAITFAKNEAYSREVAMHTRKGCRANVQARDEETGWCYKNGGQPLWGYRSERLIRGEEKKGRPIIKSIWVLDESIVAGRPAHEWVRHCLAEMAAKGASLDELRDFCNENGIPARRKQYWSISTWHSLLQPHSLLQFCGYGVWNVHRKNGSIRPASEWVVVENAHPAIITEEEARAIAEHRQTSRRKQFDMGYGKSRESRYLLSGGLFKCGRCGANMIGFRTSEGTYYVCGSQPYRRGMGCGPGVYVPQEGIETDVAEGVRDLLGICAGPKGFLTEVNAELRRIWEQQTGHDPRAASRVEAIDGKIENIRRAIEDGLSDAAWANRRLKALLQERESLLDKAVVGGEAPQIDLRAASEYRRRMEKTLRQGEMVERKRLLRTWVSEIKLAPEQQQVEMTFRIPEPIMNGVVAGAGFEPATSGL